MSLTILNQHIKLCTRRLELAEEALGATMEGDYAQADRCTQEIEETTIQIEELNKVMDEGAPNSGETSDLRNKKVCCPDCGADLEPRIHQQMVNPFEFNLYFYCTGRCHVEACTRLDLTPEKVTNGTPKFCIPLEGGLIDLEETISTAAATIEVERIFAHTPINFVPHDLVMSVYDRIQRRFKSKHFGLDAIYRMGWVYGVRAERARKKGGQEGRYNGKCS
ncbi:MAG: hypothetical protein ACM3MK_11215 [Chitinophagales bacterium]